MTKFIVAATILASLSACAPMPRSYGVSGSQSGSQYTYHNYTVNVVDAKGQPVPGVTVVTILSGQNTEEKILNCLTNEAGKCPDMLYKVNRDTTYTYVTSYSSTAKLVAEKEGFYKTTASGSSNAGGVIKDSAGSQIKIVLLKPTDYLSPTLDASRANQEVKAGVLKFLEVIKLQSILVDTEVMLGGVGVSDFKGKSYLQLKLNSSNVYNSLKLNKYDIGKTLFDESIRKILTPLNDNLMLPKGFYGYDVIIYGQTKSFTDKYALPKKVEYRFLMPSQAVRKYKDKEISGQALLDASVQLMDDERIELKLQ